jgi:hypothetical protein
MSIGGNERQAGRQTDDEMMEPAKKKRETNRKITVQYDDRGRLQDVQRYRSMP